MDRFINGKFLNDPGSLNFNKLVKDDFVFLQSHIERLALPLKYKVSFAF